MAILLTISLALVPGFAQMALQSGNTAQRAAATRLVSSRLAILRAIGADCAALAAMQGVQSLTVAGVQLAVTTTGEGCPGIADTVRVAVAVTRIDTGAELASASTRIFVSPILPCAFAHAPTAADSVDLGSAFGYSVLASAAITNDGSSVFPGIVGSSGGAIVGMDQAKTSCSIEPNTAAATAAESDLESAYGSAAGRSATGSLGGDLAGLTLGPGVYRAAAALSMSTMLVFDAGGDPTAVFVIQVPAALNTSASSTMTLAGGAQSANVFWQVSGAVTLGASSHFVGTILGNAAITMGAGTSIAGRALTKGGAATLSNNDFSTPGSVSAQ